MISLNQYIAFCSSLECVGESLPTENYYYFENVLKNAPCRFIIDETKLEFVPSINNDTTDMSSSSSNNKINKKNTDTLLEIWLCCDSSNDDRVWHLIFKIDSLFYIVNHVGIEWLAPQDINMIPSIYIVFPTKEKRLIIKRFVRRMK